MSGSHATGKTTLIDALLDALPGFSAVEEPYHLLLEEGHTFAELPSHDDFELQLERSIACVAESKTDCLFDRCPLDLLAYLLVLQESEGFDVNRWLPAVRDAVRRLDLVVFVPIEDPDRVVVFQPEHWDLRRRVDDQLRAILLDDAWSFGVPVIEVAGAPDERARQVLASLDGDTAPR